ncbi:MAG: YbhB/YbcL family Raf kinase inhibitor-like protein [Ilumatobacter sp.]
MARPPARLATALAAVIAMFGVAACDTGDGTTLQTPTAPTTTLPPDTTPLPSVPLDDPGAGVVEDAPQEPLPELPGDVEGFALAAPWDDGGTIDEQYTCDGISVAPAVSWSGVPDGTAELAVALVDESRISNGRPVVHWVVAGIDASLPGLASGEIPPGAFVALNFFGEEGYTGPCPDLGDTNLYALTLYAVGQQVESGFGTPAAQVLEVIESVSFATVTVSADVTR